MGYRKIKNQAGIDPNFRISIDQLGDVPKQPIKRKPIKLHNRNSSMADMTTDSNEEDMQRASMFFINQSQFNISPKSSLLPSLQGNRIKVQ